MSITVESATLLFIEFCKENRIANTHANGSLMAKYLRENNLVVSWKNFNAAFQALKGQLEILKTPQEVAAERARAEKEQIEKVRAEIYRLVNEKLAPASLNFADWPGVMSHISKHLYAAHGGKMTVDTLLDTVKKLERILVWKVEPKGLHEKYDYIWGQRNHARDTKEPEVQESYGPRSRINHATDSPLRDSAAEGAKNLQKIRNDEQETQRQVAEDSINGYICVRAGRVSQSQTDSIRALLRKVAAKRGPLVAMEILANMPDDARTENYIRARL